MRVKTGIIRRKRHKRVLKAAKGFRGASGDAFKQAKQATRKAMAYSTRDRKVLADIALNNAAEFTKLVETAKSAL